MTTTRLVGTIAVLDVHGTLEAGDGLRPAIRLALDNGARTIVVNLQDVTAIDSSGVSQLASGHLTAANSGGCLKLCNLSRKLKEVFIVARLNTVFDAYDTEAEAVASANV
jgi:anti-sigma B factor antagonist